MTDDREMQESWRAVLTEPGYAPQSRLFRHLPSNPRCPACRAPYGLPFGPLVRLFGFGRSARYPQLCNPCFRQMQQHRGGAEVPITVLFADVRGSTGMAERASAEDFSVLLTSFYRLVTQAVRQQDGIIDKFLGDGVMALFLPSFTERRNAERGLAAAAGELIVSGDEASLAEQPAAEPGEAWEMRELQVKGRDRPVRAWSLRLQPAVAA